MTFSAELKDIINFGKLNSNLAINVFGVEASSIIYHLRVTKAGSPAGEGVIN
jgi:hypothetical protein